MEVSDSEDSMDGRKSPIGGKKRARKYSSADEDEWFPGYFTKKDKIGFGWNPSADPPKKIKKKEKKKEATLSQLEKQYTKLKEQALGPKKMAKKEHKLEQQIEAKKLDERLPQMSYDDCVSEIRRHRPGSNDFMRAFLQVEQALFGSRNEMMIARITDVDPKNLAKYFLHAHKVIVTSSARALGYRGPPNFSFEKAKEIFKKNGKELEVINSKTGDTVKLPIRTVLDHIENGERGEDDPIYNVLSLEVSNDSQLAPLIEVPTFVKEHSLVLDVERALKTDINMDFGKKNTMSAEARNERIKRETKLSKFNQHVPRYEKYIIFSQAGAFTDLHIDLAGSGVFYYVYLGTKVIYFAEPTEENLKLYAQLELEKKTIWSCDEEILKRFQRIEVNAGEMVLIPPGFLHFVYTPVDSLVIGGNFLTEAFLPLHFNMVQLEETCRKMKNLQKTQMFKGFYEFMFLYLEKIYFPLIEANRSRISPHLIDRGRVLLEGLEHRTKAGHFYTKSEKHDLLDDLREVLGMRKGELINEVAKSGAESIDFRVLKNLAPESDAGYGGL